MTPGDIVWWFLVGLPIWALIIVALWFLTRPRRLRSTIVSPDAYGLPKVGGSQVLIESACEESLRRSRARREPSDA